jgi:hypothetical protein
MFEMHNINRMNFVKNKILETNEKKVCQNESAPSDFRINSANGNEMRKCGPIRR